MLFSPPWLGNAVFSMINVERMAKMLWRPGRGEVVLSFLPRRLSGGWWAGKGQHVGRPPGTCAGIHIMEGRGPLAAVDTDSGREACCTLNLATTEQQLPVVFPFLEPHEMVSRGEGGYTHGRSECENLGLADKMLTMKRGQHWGLGLPSDLDEVQV